MSNQQTEQFNETRQEALTEIDLEHDTHTCQCTKCVETRDTVESDLYDLKTANLV